MIGDTARRPAFRDLDHEETDGADEILFCAPMLNQSDYGVGPAFGVIDNKIVAVDPQKMP